MLDLNMMFLDLSGTVEQYVSDNDPMESAQYMNIADSSTALLTLAPKDHTTFIVLLSQVLAGNESEQTISQSLGECQYIDIDQAEPVECKEENEDTDESTSLNELEENSALVWINSEYYKPDIASEWTETVNTAEQHDIEPKDNALQKELAVNMLEKQSNDQEELVIESNIQIENDAVLPQSMPIAKDVPLEWFMNDTLYRVPEADAIPLYPTNSPEVSLEHHNLSSKLPKAHEMADDSELLKQHYEASDSVQIPLCDTTLNIEDDINPDAEDPLSIPPSSPKNLTVIRSVPVDVPGSFSYPVNLTIQNNEHNAKQAPQISDISVPIDQSEWSYQFAEHIIWFGQQGIKHALIKINPEELGPLEIRLILNEDSARLNISSTNHHTCDIIEHSLPRLQEMMAELGLNLSEVQLDTDAEPHHFTQQEQNSQEEAIQHHRVEEELPVTSLNIRKHRQGLIDYFA